MRKILWLIALASVFVSMGMISSTVKAANPNIPENLQPSTRQTTSVTISCTVTDNDGNQMNVFFYGSQVTGVSLNDPTEDGYAYKTYVPVYGRDNTNVFIKIGFYDAEADHPIDRGYIEWDVSSIPDTAIITDTIFKYEGPVVNYVDCHIHEMLGARPSTSDNQAIFDNAGSGTVYADPTGFPERGTNKQVDLGASADSDLQNQLSSDWFAIGIQADDEVGVGSESSIASEEYIGVNPKPTLYVEYFSPTLIDNVWADNGATAQVVWSNLTRGQTYTFFAGAQDNNGNWGENSATQSFTVNSLPTCSITAPPDGYDIGVNEGIQFESSASDAEGDSLTYSWDFGDGGTSTKNNPTYQYSSGGDYTVTLTVNDGYEDSAADSIIVSVAGEAAPSPPPPSGGGGWIEQAKEEVEKVVQPAKNLLFTIKIVGIPLFLWVIGAGLLTWVHKNDRGVKTLQGISYAIWMGFFFLMIMGAHIA